MPDKTKIVFEDGHQLIVNDDIGVVRDVLGRDKQDVGTPFTALTASSGKQVYVAGDKVA
jgi:hypothetical protein